ncbi:hypothetical protein [Streptomyces sp. NPDC003032]
MTDTFTGHRTAAGNASFNSCGLPPGRHWTAHELARHLGDIILGTMHRQLNRWAEDGHLRKPGRGVYTAATNNPVKPPCAA